MYMMDINFIFEQSKFLSGMLQYYFRHTELSQSRLLWSFLRWQFWRNATLWRKNKKFRSTSITSLSTTTKKNQIMKANLYMNKLEKYTITTISFLWNLWTWKTRTVSEICWWRLIIRFSTGRILSQRTSFTRKLKLPWTINDKWFWTSYLHRCLL